MKAKLWLASSITIGILFSFVFFIVLLIAFWVEAISAWMLIGLTIFINLVMWIFSPTLTDWIQNIFYKVKAVSFDEFNTAHSEVALFIKAVCEKHTIKIPRLRIIQDLNPTAYTYGSYANNARIVVSEGIFKYLNVEEQKAVVAHELGHIINRDFIIMTIAATLLEILYEIAYVFMRSKKGSSGKKGGAVAFIGLISYVFYIIGTYVILYLSRTREYLADRFSAENTGNPDALSLSLVKIAYGIAAEADTESSEKLLAATRSMGIYDYKAANALGSSFHAIAGKNNTPVAADVTKMMLFDVFSPWGLLSEINSTHPLTGKRIKALSAFASEIGLPTMFDFKRVAEEGKLIDMKRLYDGFYQGMMIYCLPIIATFCGIFLIFLSPINIVSFFLLLGGAMLYKGLYRFSKSGEPTMTNVCELMQDPYHNPMKGNYVQLEGQVIGKADAGSYLGEDLKMQDNSGGLIMLNYESPVPIIGNIFFGIGKGKKMIGQKARAVGWFRRTSYQIVDLDKAEIAAGIIKSYTRFWGIFSGAFIIGVTLIFAIFWIMGTAL
ncbi:MAG: M48 family metalloprotease [Candidatus Margulisiibacteriota bacterium]